MLNMYNNKLYGWLFKINEEGYQLYECEFNHDDVPMKEFFTYDLIINKEKIRYKCSTESNYLKLCSAEPVKRDPNDKSEYYWEFSKYGLLQPLARTFLDEVRSKNYNMHMQGIGEPKLTGIDKQKMNFVIAYAEDRVTHIRY